MFFSLFLVYFHSIIITKVYEGYEHMFTRNVTKVILLVMIDIIIIVGVYFLGLEYIARDNALVGWKLVSLFTIFVVVKLFVYFFTKLYHFLFDHVGAQEFMRIVFAATLSNFVIFFVLSLSKYAEIKWYFFLFTTPLEILLMTAVRFYRRIRRRIVNATILGAQNKFIIPLLSVPVPRDG